MTYECQSYPLLQIPYWTFNESVLSLFIILEILFSLKQIKNMVSCSCPSVPTIFYRCYDQLLFKILHKSFYPLPPTTVSPSIYASSSTHLFLERKDSDKRKAAQQVFGPFCWSHGKKVNCKSGALSSGFDSHVSTRS